MFRFAFEGFAVLWLLFLVGLILFLFYTRPWAKKVATKLTPPPTDIDEAITAAERAKLVIRDSKEANEEEIARLVGENRKAKTYGHR